MPSQLAIKSRIASTRSLGKIFNAQEMIASSHIARSRQVALEAKPYVDALNNAMLSLVAHTDIDHPIFRQEQGNNRVAVLSITADRGMAGAYTSNVIRQTEAVLKDLDAKGKKPELYVTGRRGVTYYKYRNRDVEGTWEGDSDNPSVHTAESVSKKLLKAYMTPGTQGGVSELYIVYTEFINMVVQHVRVLRMLPIELVEDQGGDQTDVINDQKVSHQAIALYTFEPNAQTVLDNVLPQYVQSRIHECLLTSAASETASRQNAMHSATENANKLIDHLTLQMNQSRQAQITQELTEIVSGADALKKKKK
jgi:F-type H+-transporting ATPase subunit gamma